MKLKRPGAVVPGIVLVFWLASLAWPVRASGPDSSALSGELAATLDQYTFMTEDYPPFNFLKDGELTGISVDLLEHVFVRLGMHKRRRDIEIHPWARGYRMVRDQPDTVLFVMTRNPMREGLFRWVGPVTSSPVVLLARKDRQISVSALSDLQDYRLIAISSDIGDLVLDAHHIPQSQRETVPYPDMAARMLMSGHVDLWAYGLDAALWLIRKEGGTPSDFEIAWDFGSAGDNYYAFHKDTPDEVVAAFQKTLDEVKVEMQANGQTLYQNILDAYLK